MLAIMNDTASSQALSARPKQRRGFAAMPPEKRRQIASKGGRTAHEIGMAHQWDSDEARAAGKKGGHLSRGGRGKVAGR
jgi:hypothetical protein